MPRIIKNAETNFLIVPSLIFLTSRALTKDVAIKTIAIINDALIFTYPSL